MVVLKICIDVNVPGIVLSASCRLSPLALTRATENWVICFPILRKIKQRLSVVNALVYDYIVSGKCSWYPNSIHRLSIML